MRRHRGRRRGQKGGGFAFDSVAGVSTGGVPFESRTAYDHCYDAAALRPAPQIGGGCGCMASPPYSAQAQRGGASGTGGHGFTFNNAEFGKVYAELPRGPCPPSQVGGGGDLVSYSAGYGFGPEGVVSTNIAHYVDPSGYSKTCVGGSRRRRRSAKAKKAKKTKKTRKH
jgi:hypothetical protein